jgi:hypothetical protein
MPWVLRGIAIKRKGKIFWTWFHKERIQITKRTKGSIKKGSKTNSKNGNKIKKQIVGGDLSPFTLKG